MESTAPVGADRLAIVRVDFRLQNKDETYGRRALDDAARAARLQPGVTAVALAAGLPVGTGGRVALLLSGGIDSPVAGWSAMRRGCRLSACIRVYPK